MEYFTRQLFDKNNVSKENDEDLDVAAKSYQERLSEIKEKLPDNVKHLLNNNSWQHISEFSFVKDQFHILDSNELTLLFIKEDQLFILKYFINEIPIVDSPTEEESKSFSPSHLSVLAQEWDVDTHYFIHRLLLNNGYYVTIKFRSLSWFETIIKDKG